jgi:large subunit ribosomal protein L10
MKRSVSIPVVVAVWLFSNFSVSAFVGKPLVFTTPKATPAANRAQLFMGGGSGYATSLDGKKARVEKLKELLDSSEMIFTIPGGSMTVKQAGNLRRSLPDGTIMMTVKNTLMERAVEGTDYAKATSLLTGPNTWFFIQEDISGTVKAYNAFLKETKKEETHTVRGGVIEKVVYDAAGVEAIGKLPSKLELYAKIAGAIKAVPTKLARVIKAPGNKLGRAIRLATMPDEDKSDAE